jgi:hypothetical protein
MRPFNTVTCTGTVCGPTYIQIDFLILVDGAHPHSLSAYFRYTLCVCVCVCVCACVCVCEGEGEGEGEEEGEGEGDLYLSLNARLCFSVILISCIWFTVSMNSHCSCSESKK